MKTERINDFKDAEKVKSALSESEIEFVNSVIEKYDRGELQLHYPNDDYFGYLAVAPYSTPEEERASYIYAMEKEDPRTAAVLVWITEAKHNATEYMLESFENFRKKENSKPTQEEELSDEEPEI